MRDPTSEPNPLPTDARSAQSGTADENAPLLDAEDAFAAEQETVTGFGTTKSERDATRHRARLAVEQSHRHQDVFQHLQESYRELFPKEFPWLHLVSDEYFVTDLAGIIRQFSPNAASLFCVQPHHLIGKPLMSFFALEHRRPLRNLLTRLVHQGAGASRTVEGVTITPRDGTAFAATIRPTPVYDSKTGAAYRIRWQVRDLRQGSQANAERFELLVDAVEDYGIFLLSEDGYVVTWNRGAERIFGYSDADIVGRPFAQLFPPGKASLADQEFAVAREKGRYAEEGYLARRDGSLLYAQGVLVRLPGGSEQTLYAKIVRDISDRKQAEEDLRARETRLQLALYAARAGTWDWNQKTNEMVWSLHYWKMIGVAPHTLPPTYATWLQTIHPDDRDAAEAAGEQAFATGAALSVEYRLAHSASGAERWVLSMGQPIKEAKGKAYRMVGVLLDITERKQAEAKLEARVQERTAELATANRLLKKEMAERLRAEEERRALSAQLVTAQEEERRRISRELHDQMGQHLTGFALNLRALRDQYPPDSGAQTILEQLGSIADELGSDVHRLAVELRPTSLDDLGLVKSLQSHVAEWQERSGIAAAFHATGFDGAERLPRETETVLYRVTQEALTNVARHSKASRAEIILNRQAEFTTLIVEDNGQGFDVDQKRKIGGRLGVVGMQERVESAGGTFDVESGESGTTIFARLPFVAANASKPSRAKSTKSRAKSTKPTE